MPRTQAVKTYTTVGGQCCGQVTVRDLCEGATSNLAEAADALVCATAAGVANVLPARVGGYKPVGAKRLEELTLRRIVQPMHRAAK